MATLGAVARLSGCSVEELRGPRRQRSIAHARFAAMWATRRVLGHLSRGSYPALGRLFARNHTTVMHGVQRAEELRLTDDEFYRLTEALVENRRTAAAADIPMTMGEHR